MVCGMWSVVMLWLLGSQPDHANGRHRFRLPKSPSPLGPLPRADSARARARRVLIPPSPFFKVWARYAITMEVCCPPRVRVRPLSLPSLPRTRSSLRSLRSLDLPGQDTVSLVVSASSFEIVSVILSRIDGKRRAGAGLTPPSRNTARHAQALGGRRTLSHSHAPQSLPVSCRKPCAQGQRQSPLGPSATLNSSS